MISVSAVQHHDSLLDRFDLHFTYRFAHVSDVPNEHLDNHFSDVKTA
jgi:hypothetical protein